MLFMCPCGCKKIEIIQYGARSKQAACSSCGNRGIPGGDESEATLLWNYPKYSHSVDDFPRDTQIVIRKAFDARSDSPSQYWVGYKYRSIQYIPATPSYYPFDEALERCFRAFIDTFPQEGWGS